jgi:elongation factor G
MPADDVTRIRSVAIVGQGGTGKTTVADALLFAAGAATRIGRVDDGTSAFDTEPEEARRKSSITGAIHHCGWKKHEVNLIDTPGYSAFLHDTRNCLAAATGVVVVIGSTGGEVKVEIEKIWAWCEELRAGLHDATRAESRARARRPRDARREARRAPGPDRQRG